MEIDLNKKCQLFNDDCINILKQLPDKSIDLILTDPPYGDNSGYGRFGKEIINNEDPLLNCKIFNECYRILKNNTTMYNFTNWKHYPFLTTYLQNYTPFNIKSLIVWNKPNIGMGGAFRNKYELIMVLEKGKPEYNGKDFATVQDSEYFKIDENDHPHKKPVDLIKKIILHSTNQNELIFDPFMGSGSIGQASLQLNRKFIGVELDSKYFENTKNKLELFESQERLF